MPEYKKTPLDDFIQAARNDMIKHKEIPAIDRLKLSAMYMDALVYLDNLKGEGGLKFENGYKKLLDANLNYNKIKHNDAPYDMSKAHIKKYLKINT